jgi:hypothetical protein
MDKGNQTKEFGGGSPVYAPVFAVIVSVLAAGIVGLAVVRGIGYSCSIGFLYFAGYFIAMLLFLEAMGYSVIRRTR